MPQRDLAELLARVLRSTSTFLREIQGSVGRVHSQFEQSQAQIIGAIDRFVRGYRASIRGA